MCNLYRKHRDNKWQDSQLTLTLTFTYTLHITYKTRYTLHTEAQTHMFIVYVHIWLWCISTRFISSHLISCVVYCVLSIELHLWKWNYENCLQVTSSIANVISLLASAQPVFNLLSSFTAIPKLYIVHCILKTFIIGVTRFKIWHTAQGTSLTFLML